MCFVRRQPAVEWRELFETGVYFSPLDNKVTGCESKKE